MFGDQNYQQSRAPQSASIILKFWLFFVIIHVFTWEKPVEHNIHYRSLDDFEIKKSCLEPKLSKKKSTSVSLQYLKILATFAILFTWEKPVGHNSHYRSLHEFEIKNPAWNQNYQQSRAPQSASSILKFWLFFAILFTWEKPLAVKSAVSLSLDHLTAVSGVEPRSGHM